MTTIYVDSNQLDPRVDAAGVLVNLLQGQAPKRALNGAWFNDPLGDDNIGGIMRRPEQLLDFLASILGDPATDTPNDDYAWFPLRLLGDATNVHVIMSKDHAASPAILGLGIWFQQIYTGTDTLTCQAYGVIPLFSMTTEGVQFVLGGSDFPAQAFVEIQTSGYFQAGEDQYQILQVRGDFRLDGSNPGFEVNFLTAAGVSVDAYEALRALLESDASDWINAVLSVSSVIEFMNRGIGTSSVGIGEVLESALLLEKASGSGASTVWKVADLDAFLAQTPVEAGENIAFAGLDLLAAQKSPLVAIGNGGVDVVKTGTPALYGIRAYLPDIGKTTGEGAEAERGPGVSAEAPADSGAANNKPQMLLQLGKWFTGETDEDNWLTRSDSSYAGTKPGSYTYFLQRDASTKEIAFKPRIELISVGFDYVGGNQSPLISANGFSLAGYEPRIFAATDLGSGWSFADLSWGGGIRLDHMGLPLGGSFDGQIGDNPVASNLLASGEGEGGQAAEGEVDPVNPSFSCSAAYVDRLSVQLYDPDDALTERVWFPIQRKFGPLACRRFGVAWDDASRFLSLLFDGGVELPSLAVELEGLSVGFQASDPTNMGAWKLGLDGLDVAFQTAGVVVSAGLLQTGEGDTVGYVGEARVVIEGVGLGAFGSYTTVDDAASLFVFAFLDAPLGGPPALFVNGVCAGFGYNRDLRIPAQSEVQSFPLVAALSDPAAIGGTGATPAEALAKLDDWVPPTRGQYWLAAGLKFTTYEIINSNALGIVRFGEHFEIDILGLSTCKLPQIGPTYAYAELDLELVFDPSDGLFAASLVVGPGSFVIDPKCKLTGGFAFYVWVPPNEHAGQFVATLGGYHPAFTRPDFYPEVPRLGFNWPVSDEVSIEGGAYFALTPSSVMAGGNLQVLYHSGKLKAWFTAAANLVIFWKPFYFVADIGVSVGASYELSVFGVKKTFKVELGASLKLFGPPTGGTVEVNWYIISFSIDFGADQLSRSPTVDWQEFSTLLPQASATSQCAAAPAAAGPPPPSDPQVTTIRVQAGLLTETGAPGDTTWFVRPDEFCFSSATSIPATASQLRGSQGTTTVTQNNAGVAANTAIGVRPMGIEAATAVHQVQIRNLSEDRDVDFDKFDYDLSLGASPVALWGQPVALAKLRPSAEVIADTALGFSFIRHKPLSEADLTGPPTIDAAAAFTFVILDEQQRGYLPLDPDVVAPTSGGPQPDSTTLELIASTITQTASRRTSIYDALGSFGQDAGANGPLDAMAQNPSADFDASPMVGAPVSAA
ncbi:MAG: DUF6603 domain-containing protein [Enhygromyxa sp.]